MDTTVRTCAWGPTVTHRITNDSNDGYLWYGAEGKRLAGRERGAEWTTPGVDTMCYHWDMKSERLGATTLVRPGTERTETIVLRPTHEVDARAVEELARIGVLVFRPRTRSGEASLARFRAGHQPAVVGTDEYNDIVAMAWLDPAEARPVPFGVVVRPEYRRQGIVAPLLHEMAQEARRHGHTELVTCIAPSVPDPMQDLRRGGLRVVSAFTTGGTSDVRVALD